MFRKLRLELTVLNAGIIAILFTLLTVGVYFFVQAQVNERATFLLSRVAADINNGVFQGFPPAPFPPSGDFSPPPPPKPMFPPPLLPPPTDNEKPFPLLFFFRVNPEKQLESASATQPFSSDRLTAFAAQVLAADKKSGQLFFDGTVFIVGCFC